MAGFRKHIWYKLLDEEGVPVSGASVWIYKHNKPGIGTEINLFTYSGYLLDQPIYTDVNGVFEFYVKDDILSKSYGYKWDDQIWISWSKDDKSGIIKGDHIFGEYKQANTLTQGASGFTSRRNKTISNYLGYLINNHVEEVFGSDSSSSSSSTSSSSKSSSSSSSSESNAIPFALVYDSTNSQTFNGNTLGFTASGDAANDVDVVQNASMLVAWFEYSPDEFDTSKSAVLLKNIDIDTPINNFDIELNGVGNFARSSWTMAVDKLDNGNFVLLCADQHTSPRLLNATIINSTGSINISANIDPGLGAGGAPLTVEVLALSGGNFAAIWGSDVDTAAYMRIYNSTLVPQTSEVTIDATNKGGIFRAAQINNGNFVVVYTRTGFGVGNRLVIYNSSGVEQLNTTLESGNIDSVGNDVIATGDGGFITSWCIRNGSFDTVIRLRKYNSSGSIVTTKTVYDPPTSPSGASDPYDTFNQTQLFKLDNGNIGIVSWNSGRKALYLWVYDQDLNVVQSTTQLTTTTQYITKTYAPARAGRFGNGRYAIVMQRNGDDGERIYVDIIKHNNL